MVSALQLLISGNAAGAVAALEEVEAATDKLGASDDKLEAQQAALAASGHKGLLLMAGGAGLVAAALGGAAAIAGKTEENVIQLQKMTGLNATAASELNAQLQALGIPADSVAQTLGRVLKNAEQFADGTTKATSAIGKAFVQLGISAADLQGKNAGQVLDMIRDKIASLPAGIQRTADVMNIFGRGAMTNQGLLRYLTASSATLDEINVKAKSFGLIFTQEQLNQAAKFGAMLRVVEMEFKGLAVQVGEAVIPALTDILGVTEKLLSAFMWVANTLGPLKGVFMVFVAALPGVLLFAFGLMKVVQAVDALRTSMTLMNALQAIFKDRVVESTAATEADSTIVGANAGAIEMNDAARASAVAAIGADDASLVANDAAETANTVAVDANTAAKVANAAAGGGEAVAGAGGAAAAGGMGAASMATAIAIPIAAGIAAGWLVGRQPITGQTPGMAEHIAHPLHTVAPHMASGGLVKKTTEGTLVVVGEGSDEAVVPVNRGGGSGGPSITVTIQNVFGTINRQIAMEWATPLAQALGEKFYTTSHGAGH